MIENLISLVREYAGDAIINNPEIPNESNEDAINLTSNDITSVLKSQLANGGTDQIMSLFKNGGQLSANPVVGTIIQNVAGNLMQKFGISPQQAGSIANSLIPQVMNGLVSRTNDPNDNSFTMEGIVSGLTGGQSGIGNLLGGLFGKK